MILRSNRQLTSSIISIESSIYNYSSENYSSESEIDQEEVNMLKREMTEILEAEPININNINSENRTSTIIIDLESYSDSEDSDYNPVHSKESNVLTSIYKYFVFTD